MAETRRKFDADFKEGAVRLVRETGKPIAQVARELGIVPGTLENWVARDRRQREGGDGRLSEDERAELVRLRRQVAELRDGARRAQTLGSPLGERGDGPAAVAALVTAQRAEHGIPVAAACRAAGVSRSWYYKWSGRGPPPRAVRREQLKAEVRRLFEAHEGKRGSPMITADLHDGGWKVSKNTVAALMREMGLAACRVPKLSHGL